jgi:drug/metabolite transporter (DMT)-like permease
MDSPSSRAWVYAALIGQVLLSAGTYLVAKVALPSFGPWTLLTLRFVIAAPAFALLLALGPGPAWPRGIWRRPGELAVLLCGPLNQLLFLVGLVASTPTHAALLYALTPIGVYLLARVRLNEPPSARKLWGMAIAFGGVALVLAAGSAAPNPARAATWHGDLLILAAVGVWALYSVEGKKIAQRDGAMQAAGWASILGLLLALPAMPWLLPLPVLQAAPAQAWVGAVYLGLFTSVVSYVLWYYALRRLEASRVAIFANLQPVATAVLARTVYGEAFDLKLLTGGALVLAGVWATERA